MAKGIKAALKKGAPTDSARFHKISATKGQIVPIKTTKQATVSKRLFTTSPVSRLTMAKTPFASSAPARRANRVSAPPTKTAKIASTNIPRVGSEAKACTEVITPERTINVPTSEKPKAKIAKRIVQAFRLSRFSTTIAECNKAVAISQGMKLAFSTGSQNQNPPQPNS